MMVIRETQKGLIAAAALASGLYLLSGSKWFVRAIGGVKCILKEFKEGDCMSLVVFQLL